MNVDKQAGKGSRQRPVKGESFRENFDGIFGKKEKPMTEQIIDVETTNEVVDKLKEPLPNQQCPHCATMNLLVKSRFTAECTKCGWSQ